MAIRELIAPSSYSNVAVALLIGLTCWALVIGSVPLLLRFVLMVRESNAYTRTNEPPVWKFLVKQTH